MPDPPAVMLSLPLLTFDAPLLLTAALATAAGVFVSAVFRRPSLAVSSQTLIALGLLALALAAGGPRVPRELKPRVAVMVDLSPSTRGATYRDEATLRARIDGLLGDQPRSVTYFADGNTAGIPRSLAEDVPALKTRWAPAADASTVLLFSDARFDAPAVAPATYVVVDPALEKTNDAAIASLEQRDERLVARIVNAGAVRSLSLAGEARDVAPGPRTMTAPLPTTRRTTSARLAPGDAWPENDALSLVVPPPAQAERWWVGDGAPPAEWHVIAPSELPTDPAAYLAPSVIVLNNIPADAITPAQGERVQQYVLDLGGGLLILGGDRAFAAGEYEGSVLGAMSPLASTPPMPAAHWTFLIDSSGSMAGDVNGRTRHAIAVAAARETIRRLPPADLLSAAGFSDQLRWWSQSQPVKDFAISDVPVPRGPTNLEAALGSALDSVDKSSANHVVLMTDGQVELPSADALAAALKVANVKVHVFAIGEGKGLPALRTLAQATGGTFAEETDVTRWTESLQQLLRQVSPRHWMTTPVFVRFDPRFVALPDVTTSNWNRTWLKPAVDELARGTGGGDEAVPMAGRSNVGSGKVAAVAFPPPASHVDALASLVQSPPRDPRLRITWRCGPRLVVEIDASDANKPLNGLSPTLSLFTHAGETEAHEVPQIGPGRYALVLDAPRSSRLATIVESGRILDRFAVAGRYPAEFDAVGNDRDAMAVLAQRTGGRVIEPGDRNAIDPVARDARISVTSYLSFAGAVLIGLALANWRRGR